MTLTKTTILNTIFLLTITTLAGGCTKKEPVAASFGSVYATTTNDSVARLPITIGPKVLPAMIEASIREPSFRVYFAFDKSHLDTVARATLDDSVKWLVSNPSLNITIEGNCDERGTHEYNLALGQRRSDSVRTYLVSSGIDVRRIDTISFGEERPVCGERDKKCWAENRRADIVTSKHKK